ncbi:hypothetical protein HK097_003030, partial [Rhizophlyctis rosea]
MTCLIRYGFESEDWRVRKESAEAIPSLLTRDAGGVDLVRLVGALVGRLRDVSDVVIHGAVTALVHVKNVVGQEALLEYVKQLNGLSRQLFKQHEEKILASQGSCAVAATSGRQQSWTEGSGQRSAGTRPRPTHSASVQGSSDLLAFGRSQTPSASSQPYTSPNQSLLSFSTQSLEFGFAPESTIRELRNNTDWKARGTAIESLHRSVTNITDISILLPHLRPFIDFLSTLLQDHNFTITLTTLHIMRETIAKIGPGIKPYLSTITTSLVSKFADNKIIIRQTTTKIIIQLMYITTPKPIISLCLHHLSHDSQRVREEVVNIVTTALLTFPEFDWELPLLVADLLTALRDSRAKVKYVTVEAYSVIAQMISPERLLRMLKEYGVEDETLQMLRIRFNDPLVPTLNPEGLVEHLISRSNTSTPRPPSSVPVEGTLGPGQGHGMVGVGLVGGMVAMGSPDRSMSKSAPNARVNGAGEGGAEGEADGGIRRFSASTAKPGILRTTKLPWEKTPVSRGSRQRNSYHEGAAEQPQLVLEGSEMKRARSYSESDTQNAGFGGEGSDQAVENAANAGSQAPGMQMGIEESAAAVRPAFARAVTQLPHDVQTSRQPVPVRKGQSFQQPHTSYLMQYPSTDADAGGNPMLNDGTGIMRDSPIQYSDEKGPSRASMYGEVGMTNAFDTSRTKSITPTPNRRSARPGSVMEVLNGPRGGPEYDAEPSTTEFQQWPSPVNDERNWELDTQTSHQPVVAASRLSLSRNYTQSPSEYSFVDDPDSHQSSQTPAPSRPHKRQLSEATRKRLEEKEEARLKRMQSSESQQTGLISPPATVTGSDDITSTTSPPPLPKQISTRTTPQPPQQSATSSVTLPPPPQRQNSTRQLEQTFRTAYATLRAPPEWTNLATALQTLLTVLPLHPAPFLSSLHDLTLTLTPHVSNLRTSVSKLAITLVGDMYTHLGRAMEPDLDITCTGLLKKIGEGSGGTFIIEECDKSLQSMCDSLSPTRIIPALLNNTDHKNAIVRSRVSQLLAKVVTPLSDSQLQKYLQPHIGETDRLLSSLCGFLREGL